MKQHGRGFIYRSPSDNSCIYFYHKGNTLMALDLDTNDNHGLYLWIMLHPDRYGYESDNGHVKIIGVDLI